MEQNIKAFLRVLDASDNSTGGGTASSVAGAMAAYERRRQLGVLRALGATRRFVMQTLLTEAGMLALAGGLLGVLLATLAIYFLRRPIVNNFGIPFLFPAFPTLLSQIAVGLLLALVSVTLAALVPAYRISHEEPADAMRE